MNPIKPEAEGGIGISSQGFESADVRRVFIRKVRRFSYKNVC